MILFTRLADSTRPARVLVNEGNTLVVLDVDHLAGTAQPSSILAATCRPRRPAARLSSAHRAGAGHVGLLRGVRQRVSGDYP